MLVETVIADPCKRKATRRRDGAPNPTDIHVGARLRQRRLELGMTQTELGRAMGLTLQQIQKYERGINRVSSSRLYDLSRALHVSVSYFFDGLTDARVAQADTMIDGEVEDPILKFETRELVRAYYGISDPNLRAKVWELAMALAPSS